MDPLLLSGIESLLFIGMFLVAVYFFIPKAIKFWRLWEESKKAIFLSNCVTCGAGAFFLLSAAFLMFIQAVGGGAT